MRGFDQRPSVTVKRFMSNTFHLAPIRFLDRPPGAAFLTQSYALPLPSLVTARLYGRHCVDSNQRSVVNHRFVSQLSRIRSRSNSHLLFSDSNVLETKIFMFPRKLNSMCFFPLSCIPFRLESISSLRNLWKNRCYKEYIICMKEICRLFQANNPKNYIKSSM